MWNCQVCETTKDSCHIFHKIVVNMEGKWVLNHFGDDHRNLLGRLVLAPERKRKRKQLSKLADYQAKALGINLRKIDKELKNYWRENIRDDTLECVYVTYFKETKNSGVHFHIFPRTKNMKKRANAHGCMGIGWEYVSILDCPSLQGNYRVIDENQCIIKGTENRVSHLMGYLKSKLDVGKANQE